MSMNVPTATLLWTYNRGANVALLGDVLVAEVHDVPSWTAHSRGAGPVISNGWSPPGPRLLSSEVVALEGEGHTPKARS